ncbi:CRTAC1 family protein [Maribacter sp. ACAM166]|uniref:CRTAC1 family protein n=1 Tax=Maribacter sp. ACAM166 TaxID=2508996 RepID=UPI0014852371|nr:CRTAC1 family protein [Maribacter sp. ACAM166]
MNNLYLYKSLMKRNAHLNTLSLQLVFFLVISIYSVSAQQNSTLFRLLPSSESGIDFNNQLFESDTLNILNQANIYNGGGVGIGDFNKDGLMDIYFAANMVSNKLYLNKGNLQFDDITEKAMVNGQGRWCTGVSVVDINADGWMDLYISASFRNDPKLRTNLLYINQGNNEKGIPVFKESAKTYGIADNGFSTQAYFFDYDSDGDLDLDLYQVTNEIYDQRTPIRFRSKLTDGSAKNTDRLYRNNGNSTFTDVSKVAGITIEGWGHAASITDMNSDGWPDIYVTNDFISNDVLYINNKNGTFTNQLGDYFKHTAWNAMGTDVVDINNDGLVDLISLEMLPENNLRKKRMLSGNEYYNYINNEQYNYNHQYVRNVLQLNSGQTPLGHPVFNDISYIAGVYETDWSWCPITADFDNDGFRDLIITNGLPRDVTDLDYITYGSGQTAGAQSFTLAMTDSLPVVKLANYAFMNTNGTGFKNTSKAWGLDHESFSNGGVYTDLDNDGDLDVVINNINDTAFVYENTLNKGNQRLTVSFEGTKANPEGIGASLRVYYNEEQQYYEHYPTRGYLSTHDPRAHFGLGEIRNIDSILINWPDDKKQTILHTSETEITF